MLSCSHLQSRLRLSLGDLEILRFWLPRAIQDNSPPGFTRTSAISSVCDVKFEKAIIKL